MRGRTMSGACAAALTAVLLAVLPTVPVAAQVVPPPAPSPTDSANSPMAPDPHPPLGGLDPQGAPVGGTAMLRRGLIAPPQAPALPAGITAQAWVLFDVDTGNILAARDPHGRYQPASILKTLTSVTLLPQLPGDQKVRTTAAEANTEGSHAGIVAGGTYTIDQLFSGMLLVSGNDAAEALANAAGGVQHTVDEMNATALRLGAYDTYAQTPSGLDGWQQLTSAYDMSIFLRAALAMPRFVAYERQASAQLPLQHVDGYGPVTMANQNEQFLTTVPGAIVAKTGYTDAAQHTFIGAISRNGKRLGVVLLRAQRYPTDQWQQATTLMDWGFALPAGTPAVGHLPAPSLVTGPTSGVAAVRSITPSAALSSALSSAQAALRAVTGTGHRTSLGVWLAVLGLGLILAGGFAHWHANRVR